MKKEIEYYIVSESIINTYSFLKGRKTYTHGENTDFYVFTGGPDVDPSLYGEKEHLNTNKSVIRDTSDIRIYKNIPKKKLKVGICRGAQFLTVMSGGSLIQDVTNHKSCVDEIITPDGVLSIVSDHHQMMNPFDVDGHVVIATTVKPKSTHYLNGKGENLKIPFEPEIVYYPNTHSLCIQGHPEWGSALDSDNIKLRNYINNLIEYYVAKFK